MAQPSFIFGGNTNLTYDQIQRQRDIANELLKANMGGSKNVGEGLGAIGRALAAKAIEKRTTRADEANRAAYEAKRGDLFGAINGILGGASGVSGGGSYVPSGTWTPEAPAPKLTNSHMGMPDVSQGGLSFDGKPAPAPAQPALSFGSAAMTPQEMLIAGAKANGLDPIDVATAISYETGGTFDPLIKGPTTQWGTHGGLIQFGDPQADKYGAVLDKGADEAWRSQLNPNNGAVWSYLKDAGVQPGMKLDQIYSAINVGGVNRFGASDANNGGAPGTVADKVAGMGPHREKAAAFLGGTWTPSAGQPPQSKPQGQPPINPAILMQLAEIQGNPYASESDKAIANVLMGQVTQAMDPAYQMGLEKTRLELDQMKNPQPGFKNMTDEEEKAAGLDTSGVYQQGADGKIAVIQEPAKPQSGFTTLTDDQEKTMGLDTAGLYQVDGQGKIYTIQEPAKPAADPNSVREYNFYAQQETAAGRPVKSYDEWKTSNAKAGAASVTVGGGEPGQYLYGADAGLPAGWRIDTRTGEASVIPNGPADVEAAALNGKKDRTATQGRLKLGTTLESLDLNIKDVEDGGMPVTGPVGDFRRTWLGRALTGAGATDFGNRTAQITDSAALAEVQNMRDNSPTGGAVGSLTDDERKAIGNAVTGINDSTSAEEYVRAATAFRKLALDLAYGEGMWELGDDGLPRMIDGAPAADTATADLASDPDFQAFSADPSAIAAAQKYGVSLEEMWAIKQGQQ